MKTLLFWLIVIAAFTGGSLAFMTQMPGDTVPTMVGPLSEEESSLQDRLKSHVETLAQDIGARGYGYPAATADTLRYLSTQLKRAHLDVREILFDSKGSNAINLEATLVGTRKKDELILLGANYDSNGKSPGADDNASGCAVLLEVARLLGETANERSIRVVFFANGAGSLAGDERSGAWHYAREAKKRGDKIVGMIDFDCLGQYKDTPGSQSLPFPLNSFYPSAGNFVCFAGQLGSRELVRASAGEFRKAVRFPCHGIVLPGFTPGMGSGDYAAFANFGFPALVATDTGTFRYDKVGTLWDTVERLDCAKMARVTAGLSKVVTGLAKTTGSL